MSELVLPGGRILIGDARERLRDIPDRSVHVCVTSPPYFGLRDYGVDGQMGLEPTPDEFVAGMVELFREVRRVLRDDGTLWLNIGDSYAGSWGARGRGGATNAARPDLEAKHGTAAPNRFGFPRLGVKPKELIGIPWRLAFAMQADGWYLRQEIIWHKPNPMPESVRDRCTKAHEQIFLLSKAPRYYFDADAIAEDSTSENRGKRNSFARKSKLTAEASTARGLQFREDRDEVQYGVGKRRNKRSVWSVTTKPFKEAHFATFPPDLIEPCILAGSPVGGTVLDPFMGAGTTALVAQTHGRRWIGCELNAEYVEIIRRRVADTVPARIPINPLLAWVLAA